MSVGSEAVFSPYSREAYQNKNQADTFKDQLKKASPPPSAPLTPDQQAVVDGDSSTLPTSEEQAPSGWSVANIANADGGLLANYLNGNCIMTVIQDGKPVQVSMFDELAKKLGFYISPQDEAKDVKSGQSLGLQAIETHVDMAWQALQTLVAFKNETMANGQSISSSVVHDGKFLGLSGHDADRGSNYGDLQDYLKDGRGPSSLQTGGDRVHGDGTTKSEAQIGWQHFVHDIKQFVTILKDAIVGLVHIVEHLAEGIIYGLMGEGDKARAAFKAFGQEAKALVEGLVAPILDPIKLHKAEQKLTQDQREHPEDTALIAADEAAVKGDKVSVALDFLFLFIPDAGELKGAAQGLLKLGESVGRDAGAKAGEETGKGAAKTESEPVPEAQETARESTPNTDHDPLPSYEEASRDKPPAYYAVNELRMDDSGQLVLAEKKSQADDLLKALSGGGDKDTKLQPKHIDDISFGLGQQQDLIVGMAWMPNIFSRIGAKGGAAEDAERSANLDVTMKFAANPPSYIAGDRLEIPSNRSGPPLPATEAGQTVSGPDYVVSFELQKKLNGLPNQSTLLILHPRKLDGSLEPGQKAYYLSYVGGQKTSLRVPEHPSPTEPQFVFTGSLSGCAFYGRKTADGTVTFTHDSPKYREDINVPHDAVGTDNDKYGFTAGSKGPNDVQSALVFAQYNRAEQRWIICEQKVLVLDKAPAPPVFVHNGGALYPIV